MKFGISPKKKKKKLVPSLRTLWIGDRVPDDTFRFLLALPLWPASNDVVCLQTHEKQKNHISHSAIAPSSWHSNTHSAIAMHRMGFHIISMGIAFYGTFLLFHFSLIKLELSQLHDDSDSTYMYVTHAHITNGWHCERYRKWWMKINECFMFL